MMSQRGDFTPGRDDVEAAQRQFGGKARISRSMAEQMLSRDARATSWARNA
jgi:hypothetical protein